MRPSISAPLAQQPGTPEPPGTPPQPPPQAAHELPFPFTLTARAENFLRGNPNLDDTIRRLQAATGVADWQC
ncbi:MAG TPA: hypothetical protein VHT28_12465 [Silvibacterium sp.]|nr:hypothetical protein [Silvibacterium sp.]